MAVLGQINNSIFIRDPRPGRQSFEHCCHIAVDVKNRTEDPRVLLRPSVNLTEPRQTHICDAKYNDNRTEDWAPEVWVSYGWCSQNCAGWQLSKSRGALVPLAGFIVPAAVFCLTVPRRYKLSVPDKLFNVDLTKISQLPMVPFVIIAAAFWVALDTVIWLAAVFVFSGPMLLSGFYEGRLDRRLLAYVKRQMDDGRLQLHIRAQILFTILVGNLQLDPPTGGGAAWKDVQGIVTDLKGHSGTESESEPVLDRSEIKPAIEKTQARLRTMLACQYSFGSTVGAPVIFYAAAFVYTLVELSTEYGDTDISNALAFGIWWMAIPHVAIVGACLLAGNNPNTLEGIACYISNDGNVATTSEPTTWWFQFIEKYIPRYRFIKSFIPDSEYGLVYQSKYQPVSMWHRGKSKQQWVDMLCDRERRRVDRLKEECQLQMTDWISVVGGTMILTFGPPVLAFLQSYYTPRVGIGCRAVTVLLYMEFQALLMLLWVWDLSALGSRKTSEAHGIFIWKFLVGFCAVATTFIAVGGTLMQIMGVYHNCLCQLNIQDWIRKDEKVLLTSRNRIHVVSAQRTWLRLGIAATVFICMVSYVAWWYQRHLRWQFQDLVSRLDEKRDNNEYMMTNWVNSIPQRS